MTNYRNQRTGNEVYWNAIPAQVKAGWETYLSSVITTATVVDKTVRYFRLAKRTSSRWELEVVLPARSYDLRFKTKKAAVAFVEGYRESLDVIGTFKDIDDATLIWATGDRYACYGGGPGWLRYRPMWIDGAHFMLHENAGGLPKHHSQSTRASNAKVRFDRVWPQLEALAGDLAALANSTEQQGAPMGTQTDSLRKLADGLRQTVNAIPALIDSAL